MKRNLFRLLAVFMLIGGSAASAKGVKYAGMHPRTGKADGGLCYIETVHVHALQPGREALYRQHDGIWIFIGDPVPFGYEGPKQKFYGHHPVTVNLVVPDFGDDTVYCYVDGPHWHSYDPPDDHPFVKKEEVHYFSGEYPPEYHEDKKRYVAVNAVYRPLNYERPVVVEVAPEYRGPIIDVRINVPVPAVGVHIGVGAPVRPATVIVEEHHVHHGKHKKHKHKKFKGKD